MGALADELMAIKLATKFRKIWRSEIVGGYNSGRHGGRPTVESGLTLDLNKLIGDRLFRPCANWGGTLESTRDGTGERVASIGYQAVIAAVISRL